MKTIGAPINGSNRLLDMLPPNEISALRPNLEPVRLPAGTTLFDAGHRSAHIYLLSSGFASITCPMSSGLSVEVGLVGQEGIPGGSRLLDAPAGPTRCIMRGAGTALRMEFSRFQDFFLTLPELHRRVLQDVQHQVSMAEQMFICNCVHSIEQRMARWLLVASDRIGDLLLNVTHDSLAKLLGCRRTTISAIAGNLQRKKLIGYRRGRMQILDQASLAQLTCECYTIERHALEALYQEEPEPGV